MRELVHPRSISRGAQLDLLTKWANVGVGKLHRPYVLRFFLLNAVQQPVVSNDAKSDPRDWLPGEHELTATLDVPTTLEPGDYTLAVAMIHPTDPSRHFRLAIDAPAKDGQYAISHVRVK